MEREVVVQDCGCIVLPEDVAARLGMGPGARLALRVDEQQRMVMLGVTQPAAIDVAAKAACPVKL